MENTDHINDKNLRTDEYGNPTGYAVTDSIEKAGENDNEIKSGISSELLAIVDGQAIRKMGHEDNSDLHAEPSQMPLIGSVDSRSREFRVFEALVAPKELRLLKSGNPVANIPPEVTKSAVEKTLQRTV